MDFTIEQWNQWQKALLISLRRAESFAEGISLCLEMHRQLHDLGDGGTRTIYRDFIADLPEALAKYRPEGQFSSIAWDLWHITRIEDAVANLLLSDGEQVFTPEWRAAINIPITDTGNALTREDVDTVFAAASMEELLRYRRAVGLRTRSVLAELAPEDRNRKADERRLGRLLAEGVLTEDRDSAWLLDYWRGKTVKGLLLMPITRHQAHHLRDGMGIKRKYLRRFA